MSMSLFDLEVLAKSGTPKDRLHACIFLFILCFLQYSGDLNFCEGFNYSPDSEVQLVPWRSHAGSSTVSRRVTSKSRRWSENYDPEVLQINDKSLSALTADGEVIGIITMEDVIEELLNEEIYDETDRHDNNS